MKRPRISVNLAISADGKISSVENRPSGWTSGADHERLLELRHHADALIVGRGTLAKDRMTLAAQKNPLRCIVSGSGNIDPAHPIFSTPGGPIHLLITGGPSTQALPSSVTVHQTTLPNFLVILARDLGVKHLHCEGGGELVGSLAALDAIDEFYVTIAAHTIFGGQSAPTATGTAQEFLPASRHFKLSCFEPRPDLGECFVTYVRK